MKLAGSAEVAGSPEQIFDKLLEPAVLTRCIPGCESMEETAPAVYDTVVKAGVGAVKGSFRGQVTVSDVARPHSYRLSIEGKSTVGFVRGGANIRLEPTTTGARIHYDGEAKISGLLASVGARLLDASAKGVAQKFFEALAREVSP